MPGLLLEMLVLLGVCFLFAGWFWAFLGAHRLFAREAQFKAKRARHIELIDLIALFVTLLPPLCLLSNVFSGESYAPLANRTVLAGLLVMMFTGMWWQGVRMLTVIGVEDWRVRFAYLAIVLPALLVGGVIAIGQVLMAPSLFATPDSPPPKLPLRFVFFMFANGTLGLLVGFANRWVLSRAGSTSQPDELDESAGTS